MFSNISLATPERDDLWKIVRSPSISDGIEKIPTLIFEKDGKRVEFSSEKRLIINLIGTSGSGKSTQGEMLSNTYGIPHISIGDIYRIAIQNRSDLGQLMMFQLKTDTVYSVNELCLGILANRLAQPDCMNGFILDGFPRTQIQGIVFNRTFLKALDVHIPVFLNVEDRIVIARLANRWYCQPCNLQVREHDEVEKKGFCPHCDEPLTKREDDGSTEKLEGKLRVFANHQQGIVMSIEQRDPIHFFTLDESAKPIKVYKKISKVVEHTLDEQASKKPSLLLSTTSVLLVTSIAMFVIGVRVIQRHNF